MGKNKQFAFPMLITALLVILIVSLRSFLLRNIVEPIALLFWALWRVITSVDQQIYWISLIIFCSILVLRLFPSEADGPAGTAYKVRNKSLSRVEHWQTLIKNSALGKAESSRLRDSLEALLMAIIADDKQFDSNELEEIVAKGKVSIPFATQHYLFSQVGKDKKFPEKFKFMVVPFVPRWLRKWMGKFIHQDYTLIEETLRWMEIKLEINDEN